MDRERQRVASIAREYQAKVADLRQKYAMSVTVEWRQTLELVMPVQRLLLQVRRRKGERLITLDWNPLARKLERFPCEYSYADTGPRLVCDDRLHLVVPEAHGACGGCGKSYCRACHFGRCPKCGRQSTTPAADMEF